MFNTNETYNEYKSKFGSNRVGMLILNSCTNDLVIVRKILELNKYGIQDDGTTRSIDITGNVLGEYFTNIFGSNTISYPVRQIV